MTIDLDAATPSPDHVEAVARSRRALLAGAAGSLAALLAARLVRPDPTAAAAGDPLILGATNVAGTANTTVQTSSTGSALLVTQNGTGTALRGSALGGGSTAIAGFFTATNGTGISGVTAGSTSIGVYGASDAAAFGGGAAIRAAGQHNHGLVATTSDSQADAVRAVHGGNGTAVRATAANGVAVQALGATGVAAEATGTSANGVAGLASSAAGGTGVRGETLSPAGRGVHGIANVGVATDTPIGVLGETTTPDGIGVQGNATAGGTGVQGDSPGSIGVRGTGDTGVEGIGVTVGLSGGVNSVSATDFGVSGYSHSSAGTGVQGLAHSTTGTTVGVLGYSLSSAGTGAHGLAYSATGTTIGVLGEAMSTSGIGVKGIVGQASGGTTGVRGEVASTDGVGVRGVATAATGNNAGVLATSSSTGGIAVFGQATSTTGSVFGVFGETSSTTTNIAAGVWGLSNAATGFAVGVYGQTMNTGNSAAVLGWAFATSGTAQGVAGLTQSPNGTGVFGLAGPSPSIGVMGQATGNGFGLYSMGNAKVAGSLDVTGSISKGGGGFKVDHPLDPANKFLSHSFVESPDMKNIYDGVVTLDGAGEGTVTLPDWFEKLNRDFRYQLTPIGVHAPVFVRSRIKSGRFTVAGGAAGQEVSWQVTGIRKDAWAGAHRIAVEETKKGAAKGRYLHPVEHGQPASMGITDPAAVRRAIPKAPKRPTLPA
jgi:trimeric autotransporter adhesin